MAAAPKDSAVAPTADAQMYRNISKVTQIIYIKSSPVQVDPGNTVMMTEAEFLSHFSNFALVTVK